jgi:protein tyrosine/serine phosphatase
MWEKGVPRFLAVIFLLQIATAVGVVGLYFRDKVEPRAPAGSVAENADSPSGEEGSELKKISAPGLENVYQVTPELFRGAQPTAQGLAHLKTLGVKTVVNLRSLHSDRDEIGESALAYERIRFDPWKSPEIPEIVRFLHIVGDPNRTPVFVHCRHGMDRTGFMCAAYRVVFCGWSKEAAIREWRDIGFHEDFYESYVTFLKNLDVEAVTKRAGLKP